MKLDWAILGRVTAFSQDSECLQDADSAGAIVVRAWCRQEREQIVCRVLVRPKNGQRVGKVADLRFKARDNGRLRKGMGKIFERDMGAERGVVNDL